MRRNLYILYAFKAFTFTLFETDLIIKETYYVAHFRNVI